MPQINIGTAVGDGTGELGPRGWLAKIDQYGQLNDKTVNAAFYKTASITNEAAITLAIVAAAALGTGAAVWIPASMLPYNASLVTFNNAVKMIREGGDPSEFDVEAYGADFLITNSTVAVQAAVDAQSVATTGVVRVPRQYYVSTVSYYTNTIIRGNGGTTASSGGSGFQQLNVAQPIFQPKTPASVTKSFVFEDLLLYSGFGSNTGGIDCTNCAFFSINRVVISTVNSYGFRVVGGPVSGNAGFGQLTDVKIVNVTAGAYAFLIVGSANDQPDGMSFTDCYCSSAQGTWISYSGTPGHGATSQSWKGCRFESPGGSALSDVTVDANGAGPIWFTNCRFENTGSGGVQFNLTGIGGSPCAQFQNCSIAYGAGGLTWVDNGPVLSPRIGELNTSLVMVNRYTTRIEDRTVALISGTTPALNAALGDRFTLAILTNIAVVIAIPTNAPPAGYSQQITVVMRNASGGALSTAPTFNTGAGGFKFSAVTNPANGTQVEYVFRWDSVQSFWFEVGTHLAAGL